MSPAQITYDTYGINGTWILCESLCRWWWLVIIISIQLSTWPRWCQMPDKAVVHAWCIGWNIKSRAVTRIFRKGPWNFRGHVNLLELHDRPTWKAQQIKFTKQCCAPMIETDHNKINLKNSSKRTNITERTWMNKVNNAPEDCSNDTADTIWLKYQACYDACMCLILLGNLSYTHCESNSQTASRVRTPEQ